MALERAREYELKERAIERGALSFYESAMNLMLRDGGLYTHHRSDSYLQPLPGSMQGGELEVINWNRDFNFVVFAAKVNRGSNDSSVILTTPAKSVDDLKRTCRRIGIHDLYSPGRARRINSFNLFLTTTGDADLDALLADKRPTLEFDVGHFEPKDNAIEVYGKSLIEKGRLRRGLGGERVYQEFEELVSLIADMDSLPASYTALRPNGTELEKTPA